MISEQLQQYNQESRKPLVSIVLPVYNGKEYLREAIDSMLNQTFTDFELIIINDGSSDESANIIAAYSDPRIYSVQQDNQGLAATLNRGIALARGKYIARQDQDDVSLPERLARQVEFLQAHPDYGMVGTWATILEGTEPTGRTHRHPEDNLRLKFELLFDNPFVHSSVMFRASVIESVGGYSTDRDRQPPEDYELWSRVARRFKVANIPGPLHVYREMPQSMSRTGDNPFLRHVLAINKENIAWCTADKFSDQSIQDLAALIHGQYGFFSRKTSVREMIDIIYASAKNLSDEAGMDSVAIHEEIQIKVNNLRYHYVQAKYFGLLGDSGRGLLHRALRNCRRIIQRR
jgi:glycosyltransferase involved in cell wall biosynthesis